MKQTETLVWLIYDITVDKKRGRVAKLCKEAGLYRVQKSVFLGTIDRSRLDELLMQVGDLIDKGTDSVYAFPLCQPPERGVHDGSVPVALDLAAACGQPCRDAQAQVLAHCVASLANDRAI